MGEPLGMPDAWAAVAHGLDLPPPATCAAIAASARLRSQADWRTECQLFAIHGGQLVDREDWSA